MYFTSKTNKQTNKKTRKIVMIKTEVERGEGLPGDSVVKNPAANARRHRRFRFDPWVGKIP